LGRLRVACVREGIACRFESRVKSLSSVMRKVLFSETRYKSMGDRVGVRVVLRYVDQFETLRDRVVQPQFDVISCVDMATSKERAEDQFGYAGHHLYLTLGGGAPAGSPEGCDELKFELQVHTEPQSVWATISHGLVYKREGADPTVMRGMGRLAALLETSDLEVLRVRDAVAANAEMRATRVLRVLEDAFLPMAHDGYDLQLNRRVVAALEPVVSFDNVDAWEADFRAFIVKHSSRLLQIVEDYRDDTRNALVCQPAGLLALFAFDRDRYTLADGWPEWIGSSIFESFKGIWA
jgi:ppGpp synthetase/RelA/SpoT-type nucleotidyltranferase